MKRQDGRELEEEVRFVNVRRMDEDVVVGGRREFAGDGRGGYAARDEERRKDYERFVLLT